MTVESGGDPPAADDSYYTLRAIERILPDGQDWRTEMLPLMYPGTTMAARELVTAG